VCSVEEIATENELSLHTKFENQMNQPTCVGSWETSVDIETGYRLSDKVSIFDRGNRYV
jgi:hypothetical protein